MQLASVSTDNPSSAVWVRIDQVIYLDEPVPTEEPNKYRSLRKLYPEWHKGAACIGAKDVVFFGGSEDNDRPPFSNTDVKTARALCTTCPVFYSCLDHALTQREEYGVWAGTTQKERKAYFRMLDAGLTTVDNLVVEIGALREQRRTIRP